MEISWRLRAKTILAYPATVVSLSVPIRERPNIRINLRESSASVNTSNTPGISYDAFTLSERNPSRDVCHNQVKLNRIRDGNFIVVLFSNEQFQCCLLCDSALVVRMEKHITDKDFNNGRMNVDFKSSSCRPGVDMRKYGVFEGNLAVKESKFLVIGGSLVRCPNGRMFRPVMLFILINSKTVRPCHFCCLLGSLTKLFGVSFWAVVNTELTSNGNHF